MSKYMCGCGCGEIKYRLTSKQKWRVFTGPPYNVSGQAFRGAEPPFGNSDRDHTDSLLQKGGTWTRPPIELQSLVASLFSRQDLKHNCCPRSSRCVAAECRGETPLTTNRWTIEKTFSICGAGRSFRTDRWLWRMQMKALFPAPFAPPVVGCDISHTHRPLQMISDVTLLFLAIANNLNVKRASPAESFWVRHE